MGVQFMQANSLYSQLLQVGNLLHIGQHEACHNWRHGGGGGGGGEGGGGGGGYFRHLLEGEEASISDTKPLIMRSYELNGTHGPINGGPTNNSFTINTPPLRDFNASEECHQAACLSSPNCIESKPSISGPLKRARESSHIEGVEGFCKREKKASEERQKGGGGGGQQKTEALAGRKVTSVKAKAPKPAPIEPPKTDYVHVRARRGQATDSHSLAERVRREKISERMRFLQDLVPGCSKITGKAMILDEIINYVQSLQNQVEFLAMRLATINPKLDHASLNNFTEEEIASPFVEEVKECIEMLPRNLSTQAPSTADLQFECLPAFYSGLFDEANFNTSIVSELSTSTCNDSNLTNMDFSHLS